MKFDMMKEMYAALGMHTFQKRLLFRQGQLNNKGMGMVIMGLGATLLNHIHAFRSEF